VSYLVALVRIYVSEECIASIIWEIRISELGTTLAATSNLEAIRSSETSVLTRATKHHIPEDGILKARDCFSNI
jgi:hypothetical protein